MLIWNRARSLQGLGGVLPQTAPPSGHTYLDQLDEVLGQLVIRQVLLQTAHGKVADARVWVVAVQQFHGLLRPDGWPVFQKTIHLDHNKKIT